MNVAQQRPCGGKIRVNLYRLTEFLLGIGEFVFVKGFVPFFKRTLGFTRSVHGGHADGGSRHALHTPDENGSHVILPYAGLEAQHGPAGNKAWQSSANFTALVLLLKSLLCLERILEQADRLAGGVE